MTHTPEQFTELVRIAKLQLSGMRDPAIAGILPGAPRISISVSDLLDEMLLALRGQSEFHRRLVALLDHLEDVRAGRVRHLDRQTVLYWAARAAEVRP